MANLVAVMGASGTGKSTGILPNPDMGIKGLNPDEILIINVSGKPLPTKGYKRMLKEDVKLSEGKNHIYLEKPEEITSILQAAIATPRIKHIVVDDAGYVMGFDVIANASNKGYDKWTKNAVNFMAILNTVRQARPDLEVTFIFHTEVGKDDRRKIKTSGAMLDNNIYLDGLFTVILESDIYRDGADLKYGFRTKSDGTSTCKSPIGMFEDDIIPNDLGYVWEKVREYYG
jgi:hypothetical protein